MNTKEPTTVIFIGALHALSPIGVFFRFLPLIVWITILSVIVVTWGANQFWQESLRILGIVVLVLGMIPYLKYPLRWNDRRIEKQKKRREERGRVNPGTMCEEEEWT